MTKILVKNELSKSIEFLELSKRPKRGIIISLRIDAFSKKQIVCNYRGKKYQLIFSETSEFVKRKLFKRKTGIDLYQYFCNIIEANK